MGTADPSHNPNFDDLVFLNDKLSVGELVTFIANKVDYLNKSIENTDTENTSIFDELCRERRSWLLVACNLGVRSTAQDIRNSTYNSGHLETTSFNPHELEQ